MGPHSNFYPRSPCGERQAQDGYKDTVTEFLSTLSLRRATSLVLFERLLIWYFYPRSPCGERRKPSQLQPQPIHFYPRSPCGERRCPAGRCTHPAGISIHALLAESDLQDFGLVDLIHVFLSTLSLRRATLMLFMVVIS